MHPAKHLVTPDDVAAVIEFLLLRARGVTGQVLAVDQGLSRWRPTPRPTTACDAACGSITYVEFVLVTLL